MTPAVATSDWAGLPKDILDLILDRLISLQDYIRFAAVCVDWNTAALDDRNHRNLPTNTTTTTPYHGRFWHHHHHHHHHQQQQLPMLMLPLPSKDGYVNTSCFYSVAQESLLEFLVNDVPYRKRFVGSSFGWVIAANPDFTLTLFNPFSHNNKNNDTTTSTIIASSSSTSMIRLLPSLFPQVKNHDIIFQLRNPTGSYPVVNIDYFFYKAILSAEPTLHPSEYIVMVIYGVSRRLCFIAPGVSQDWVHIKGPGPNGLFCDVVYSGRGRDGDLFYALHDSGEVTSLVIDIHHRCKVTTSRLTPALRTERRCHTRYVIESCGSGRDLLQVLRLPAMDDYSHNYDASEFKVYRFERKNSCPADSSSSEWVELKSLGDDVLFLGDNASLSVLASDFPGGLLRPGSIYYSLCYRSVLLFREQPYGITGLPLDMGVVNLESRQFDPYELPLDGSWEYAILNQPPIWVAPTFQDHGGARVKKRLV